MTLGSLAKQAADPTRHSPTSKATQMLSVSLTATNYVAQIAGGAAVNSVGPFTTFSPTRLPQIVLGAGGVAVTYTITGTDLAGAAQTDQIVFAAAGTTKGTKAFGTITALTSNVDPVGTTDLQAVDTWISPPARAIIVGSAGAIAMQLEEDAAVATSPSIPTGVHALGIKRINISGTAASNLALLF
jgi:hypothetical protein